ncbi:hypothetical protein Hanom_Chr00s002318g01695731 [Helianthus anomalus]
MISHILYKHKPIKTTFDISPTTDSMPHGVYAPRALAVVFAQMLFSSGLQNQANGSRPMTMAAQN